MLVDIIKQHLEKKILNPIRRKLTLRLKRTIIVFITQYWNEKCSKWHFRDPRFKTLQQKHAPRFIILDDLRRSVLSSRAFTVKISRHTWRMSTSRRNRNKFTIRRIITYNNTCATLKNTNVLTIYRRSDGGAVIRNLIHRYIRALHEATKMIGCDIYYYDPYKATITMTTRLVNIIIPRDGYSIR